MAWGVSLSLALSRVLCLSPQLWTKQMNNSSSAVVLQAQTQVTTLHMAASLAEWQPSMARGAGEGRSEATGAWFLDEMTGRE